MKQYLFLFLFICIPFLHSCEDPALEQEYGEALIYMPQATHNLGTDNNLSITLVPSSDPDTTITLGIYRSGLQKLQKVTVDLVINTDTLAKAQAIAQQPDAPAKYDIYKTGVILPSGYYDPLPSTLTILDGDREATTSLVLKKEMILTDFTVGDILLLPVQIKNPTLYELNTACSLTMVVIIVGP